MAGDVGCPLFYCVKGTIEAKEGAGREEIEGLGQRGMRARRGMEGKDE